MVKEQELTCFFFEVRQARLAEFLNGQDVDRKQVEGEQIESLELFEEDREDLDELIRDLVCKLDVLILEEGKHGVGRLCDPFQDVTHEGRNDLFVFLVDHNVHFVLEELAEQEVGDVQVGIEQGGKKKKIVGFFLHVNVFDGILDGVQDACKAFHVGVLSLLKHSFLQEEGLDFGNDQQNLEVKVRWQRVHITAESTQTPLTKIKSH